MTLFRRTWLLFLWLLVHGATFAQLHEVGDGSDGPVKAAHVTAELAASVPAASPQASSQIALILHLESGWHVYWVNAGDSGEAPNVDWVLPAGMTVGKMQFPTPKRLPLGPLMDYGYEGTAVFPFEMKLDGTSRVTNSSEGVGSNPVTHLKAHVRWLVCREVCVPGKAFLGLGLPVSANQNAQASLNLIAAAIRAEPVVLPQGESVMVSGSRDHLVLRIETGKRESGAEFYPLDEDALRNAAEQRVVPNAQGVLLTVERGDISDTLPAHLKGIVKLNGNRSYLIDVPVKRAAPAVNASGTSSLGFTLAILLALTGGLVLNLMPCVFPILFLKALSLAGSATEDRRTQRLHGFSYTAGILVSFWTIVAVLLVLRAGGRQAGWGFQLQSPVFVVLMSSLLFFMALSLAGQFDLGLSLTSKGDALTRRPGYAGSFFTGVLATVVATPCTAPLMGAAIGFALSQSALVTFTVFTSLALGLAFPYLALTFVPGWANKLPRPGRWMETLKQLTSVPLFLTVIWLAWVYGRLSGSTAGDSTDHVARLLVGLLILAIGGWILGRWPARRWGYIAAAATAAAALAFPFVTAQPDRLQWRPFSNAALEEAQNEGKPVFVDFTAAWCLSCQVNEKAVLQDRGVEQELLRRHYVLLRADWTRYDPEITANSAVLGVAESRPM